MSGFVKSGIHLIVVPVAKDAVNIMIMDVFP